MNKWTSVEQRVTDYLTFRRSLGYLLKIEGQELNRFAKFSKARKHRGVITVELALAWANDTDSSNAYRARRLDVVRGLTKFCSLYEPETEIPGNRLLGPSRGRSSPYIYTNQEIAALIAQAQQLIPIEGMRPITMGYFLGLLACTGLRVSEAVHLKNDDVDLDGARLTIRNTKFRKSRYVALDKSAVEALTEYCVKKRGQIAAEDVSTFFVIDGGLPLTYRKAAYAFQVIKNKLGWDTIPHRRPRLYDLRHTFACQRILKWYQEGVDVDWALPFLSTYLGHVKVSDTYWYLTGIPELMSVVSKRFEHYAETKEVEHENIDIR